MTVAFHHVDMMQIVHNVQYLKWFEIGRFGILNQFIDFDWAVANNLAVPVVMNHCEYLSPAVFSDEELKQVQTPTLLLIGLNQT